jgi:hypothetical protein
MTTTALGNHKPIISLCKISKVFHNILFFAESFLGILPILNFLHNFLPQILQLPQSFQPIRGVGVCRVTPQGIQNGSCQLKTNQ